MFEYLTFIEMVQLRTMYQTEMVSFSRFTKNQNSKTAGAFGI